MADFIKSIWRVTWNPGGAAELVLLDYGDRMLAEPTFPQEHEVQPVPHLRADYKTFFGRGLVSYETTFSRVTNHATHAELCSEMLNHSIAIAALRDGKVKMEIQGGDSFELLDAAVGGANPNNSRELAQNGNLGFVYRVSAGELKKIVE